MDRLLSVTNQPLWRSMRCRFYEQNPTRIKPMMAVHLKIVNAFEDRNAAEAIQALEEDLDSVLEQLYNMG
jgi:DNA-binding GntR family transcriptional regulator